MLDDLPTYIDGMPIIPAASHLFTVTDTTEKLDKHKRDIFQHNVANLLFPCKQARPDIQTAIAFLCTRMCAPDLNHDYKKYLHSTSTLPLTIEVDTSGFLIGWVNAPNAVHPDMKGHTGRALSIGKCVTYGTSTRQKLVTQRSKEAELVGIHDVLLQFKWT